MKDSYSYNFVIAKGTTVIDNFESGSISTQTWKDQSQSGTTPYVGTPAYEGSEALQIDADPGTNTRGELVTQTGYQGSIYSSYIQKKRDGGGQNSLEFSLIDDENGETIRIVSSSYSNPDVELSEYDSSRNRVNNWTLGSELGTGNWFEANFSFNDNNLDVKWGSISLTDLNTNHNFDSGNLKVRLKANGWGSGHKMHAAFDNIIVE